ncbi:MAG: hypothetical protein AB1454_08320 [Candidatus Auribacterota bacterium]
MCKRANVILRSIFSVFAMSLFVVIPAFAAIIDFQDKAVGTEIIDQYDSQGIEFNSGMIDQDYLGGLFLRAANTINPYMELIFTNPIYLFSAKIYETSSGFEPQPETEPQPDPDENNDPNAPPEGGGPETSDPDPDLPPTDEGKPDESIYPTLYFTDNSFLNLEVIHALGEWKTLSFQSDSPVEKVSLLGHYSEGTEPVYFFIDDISFSTTAPIPEPSAMLLFLYGLYWMAKLRNKVK